MVQLANDTRRLKNKRTLSVGGREKVRNVKRKRGEGKLSKFYARFRQFFSTLPASIFQSIDQNDKELTAPT